MMTMARYAVLLAGCLALVAQPVDALVHSPLRSYSATVVHPNIHAAATLCEGTIAGHVDLLTVTRSRPLNAEHFGLASKITSSRSEPIRALANVVCSLPRVPQGNVTSCPNDFGVTYTLRFAIAARVSVGGTFITPVTYDATGCRFIAGAGAARRSTEGFILAMGAALGVAHPTFSLFAGVLAKK